MDEGGGGPPLHTAKEALDAYIYNYLISRNMTATAQSFAKETQEEAPSAPDLQKLSVHEGFLSDWWSIFWDSFSSSLGDLEQPDGYALEENTLEAVGGHFSLEEQMQQRAATLPNPNQSNNDVFSPTMQQEPVTDSAVYQRCLGRTPIDANVPGLVQQPNQHPTDDKGANDKRPGLPTRDVPMEKTKGVAIEEVFSLKASQKKIFCCSFSSNGELLASAGDENKVFIWNLRNNLEQYTWEAHSSFITDMSFGPNKTMLATASSDKTVRLWDVSQGGGHHIQTFVGHSSLVRSVDFHPEAGASLVCSCDDGGKVLFWKIDQQGQATTRRTSEATGRGKVRFSPLGNCIASAIGNTVNLTDVQTDKRISCMQGNDDNKTVHSVCWSERIRCLACVSDDCVRLFPAKGGRHAGELKGTKLSYYRSCSFHPNYPNTLVIGGYQTITLWDIVQNKVVSVQPHGCHVSDLAGCRDAGLLASASQDGCVKVWR